MTEMEKLRAKLDELTAEESRLNAAMKQNSRMIDSCLGAMARLHHNKEPYSIPEERDGVRPRKVKQPRRNNRRQNR